MEIFVILVLGEGIHINRIKVEETTVVRQLVHKIYFSRDIQTSEPLQKIGLTWAAFDKFEHIVKLQVPMCLKKKVFQPVCSFDSYKWLINSNTVK